MLNRSAVRIRDRDCTLYGDPNAPLWLVQPGDDNDLEALDGEIAHIGVLAGEDFFMAALRVEDWEHDLTPWPTPQPIRGSRFGDGAGRTLFYIENTLLPALGRHGQPVLLGGYSLAGLFALWAGYNSDAFAGVAGVSPSVWYPDWRAYIDAHAMRARAVYLSLGEREPRGRGPMAAVGEGIEAQHAALRREGVSCALEWNPGNHFTEPALRTAKGFAWLIGALGETAR